MNSRHSGFNEEGQGTANSDANCPGEIHEGNKVEWKTIELDEIEVQEQIGGGSVGIVHRGKYKGESVALKTLVRREDTGVTQYSKMNRPDARKISR